ncbi:MAG: UDP-N-acetylmuramate--alanine ligase [Rhodospirillales bacterium]|nr:UDP-N-acetylmuramate--alanine ligase [Rhodospirillales bacterium]
MSKQPENYFLCGIGGSGMSALALLLRAQGHVVSGSDRAYDRGQSPEKFKSLQDNGITLFPQDGSGITADTGHLVVSSAVEDTIPDVRAALDKGIPVIKRAELLAALFNAVPISIGIGGTSGKTTVTAMTGHIFQKCGKAPTIVNGGLMLNFLDKKTHTPTNLVINDKKSDVFIAELDESDGSIALFTPCIAVLNNVTLDHKPLSELRPLFHDFVSKAGQGAVINLDDPEAAQLKAVHPQTVTYGIENINADLNAVNLKPSPTGMDFELDGQRVSLIVPGRHNVSNALAAIAAARLTGIPVKDAAQAMESFTGVHRRMEVVGTANDITVIDDFAHNPDKIAASLATLRAFPGRILAVFQSHGFGPTKLLRAGLVQAFAEGLGDDDILLMPEIYYAGGTADKVISARDIIEDVKTAGKQAQFFETRAEIIPFLTEEARPGDRIVIMGARDDTLTDFAAAILAHVR